MAFAFVCSKWKDTPLLLAAELGAPLEVFKAMMPPELPLVWLPEKGRPSPWEVRCASTFGEMRCTRVGSLQTMAIITITKPLPICRLWRRATSLCILLESPAVQPRRSSYCCSTTSTWPAR